MIYRNGNLFVPPEKNTKEKGNEQVEKKKTVKRTASDSSQQKTPVEVVDNKEKNEVSALIASKRKLRKITAEVTKRIRKTLSETGKDEVEMIPTLNDSKTFSKVYSGSCFYIDGGELLCCFLFNSKWKTGDWRTDEWSINTTIDEAIRRDEWDRLGESRNS